MGALITLLAVSVSALTGEGLYERGHDLEREGKYADAMSAYLECAETDPYLAPYARIRAAACRSIAGDPDGAIRELNAFLQTAEAGPWIPYAHSELARLLKKQKQYEDALPHFRQALPFKANIWWLGDYRWQEAETRLDIKDEKEAGYAYFRSVTESTAWYAKRLEASRILAGSDWAEDRMAAALGLLRSSKYKEAGKVAASIPAAWVTAPNLQTQWKHLSARLQIAVGNDAEGRRMLRELAADQPTTSWAQAAMLYTVISLIKADKIIEAEAVAQRMAKAYPHSDDTVSTLRRIARGYKKANRLDDAVRILKSVAQDHAENGKAADALMDAGRLLREGNRRSEALVIFDEVTSQFPNSAAVPESAFWAGAILLDAKQPEDAAARFRLAVKTGLTNYYGHRAQEELQRLGDPDTQHIVKLKITPNQSIVLPIPMENEAPRSALDIMETDPRYVRLNFFANRGYPEAEWEAVTLGEALANHADPALFYRGMGEAGTAYTAMQYADAYNFGVNDDGTQTLDRLRVRYPQAYWELTTSLAKEYNLDPYLILAVARQESTYRPALSSSAGASGVMQLMPATATWLANVDGTVPRSAARDLSDPRNSLRLGAAYLRRMMDRSEGNLVYALAAYNAGPGNCDKWRRRFRGMPITEFIEKIPFAETQNYVKRILAHYATYHSLYPPSK
ncbi:MAG: hypothetical protein COA73_17905 [Candidatus Hydrogenedentota bacterium]|nr:MAG: hypothetical protein COA73_17905 [Candidatus Hydrogenedentota bacterium]